MFDQLKKLVGHSAVYGFGVMSLKISPLILTPLFLHLFSKSQYGAMEVLNTYSSNIQTIMMLGIGTVLIKVYMNDCHSDQDRRELMSSLLGFAALLGIVLVVPSYFARDWVASLLLGKGAQGSLIVLSSLSCAFILFDRLVILCVRAKQWPGWYTVINFAHVAAVVGFNLYLVGYKKQGVYGTQLAAVLVALATSAIGMILIRQDLGFTFSYKRLRHVLGLSLPLIPVSIAPWVLNVSDRYFLVGMHGLDVTGLYAVGYKIGQMSTSMFVMAFQLAWSPLFFANAKKPEGKAFCANVLKYYLAILLGATLLISIFAPELLRVMGKEAFWSAASLVPYIALSYALYGLHFFTVPLFVHANKGGVLSLIMLSVAALNLGANYVLIKFFSISGAVASTLISFAVLAIVSMIFANRAYKAPYPVLSIVKSAVVAVGIFMLYRSLVATSWPTLLLKSTSIIVFPSVLYAIGYFTDTEKRGLGRVFSKMASAVRVSR